MGQDQDRRGWQVQWIEDRGYSAKDLRRPGIREALALLGDGAADALVVAKLDRLSRSLLERRLIGQRTAEALRAKRAAGVRLGRPPALPDDVRQRISEARRSGATYAAIADALNRDGADGARGDAVATVDSSVGAARGLTSIYLAHTTPAQLVEAIRNGPAVCV